MTNNVDRITTFNGTSLGRPPFCTTNANFQTFTNEIEKALDVDVYKNSLLIIRPTIVGSANPEAQMIRSSIPSTSDRFNLINFVGDIAGNGAATPAPTGDWILSKQFLRDAMVVWFLNSTWLFRFTGSTADPFRFDRLNTSKSTNAPYGTIAYDLFCTSMGNKGLIKCDGVNVDRYDETVIDQFLDIEPLAFGQCYGLRYDNLQQSFMLYPGENDALGAATQLTSSRILVYNFLEDTWATFKPNLGQTENDAAVANTLSCVGLGFTLTDATWASFAAGTGLPQSGATWESWGVPWGSAINLASQPALLAGDQNGFIYQMYTTDFDDGRPIVANILTKRYNPFIPAEKAAFGYLDVYYEVQEDAVLTFDFYVNNSEASAMTKTMTLTGNGTNSFFWKRIYLSSLVGQFIQIGITDNGVSSWKILGMILHAAPAGRLTPGSFL